MCQYQGREATIIPYPEQGDMITVHVGSKRIRWSKREYVRPLPEINDDIWVRIFSLLGSPDYKVNAATQEKELLWIRDAVPVHTQLASVCQSWRSICHRHLPTILGRLNVNLDAVPKKTIVPMVQWLGKYHLAMGVLKFDAELEDLALLEEMLTRCDTEKLTIVRAYVNKKCRRLTYNTCSSWISSAYVARAGRNQMIDLTNESVGVTFEMQAQHLGVPIHELTQKQFHDNLAFRCPNLQRLSLSVMASKPLEVSLGGHLYADRDWPVDGLVFYKMVKNLSNLDELSIKCPHLFFNGRRLHIVSPSLKTLDTTGLCKGVWVSCECQKLERFKCQGGAYGNGTRPTDLGSIESFVSDGDLRVNAGQVEFYGLDVPNTCECILRDFVSYDWVQDLCRNARFETW